jgi:3,4-dihydroxy 2-butanone 4-phosphate synthase/GTP cyclohydrolase II
MNDDGTMARMPDLEVFAQEHGFKIVSVADIIRYRLQSESLVRRASEAELPTEFGDFKIFVFDNDIDSRHHVALVKGEILLTKKPW